MEHLDTINNRLRDLYGISLFSADPKFRIVWSDDQYETRYGTFKKESPSGLILGEETGFKYVRKYSYIKEQWILERLCDVPSGTELTVKQSYEPVWAFGKNDPRECWDAVKILIDTVLENVFQGKSKTAKYKESWAEGNTKEAIKERVQKLQKILYPDETPLADAIHFGEGVAVPNKDFVNDTNVPLIKEN